MSRDEGHGNDPRPATAVKCITQRKFLPSKRNLNVDCTRPLKERKVKHDQVIRQRRKRQVETNETTQPKRNGMSRSRPKPDPDVYDWPKEWLPNPDTPLVPANTSALRIDPPKSKPPCHVYENTFYLQSPPKMRSEMEPWKLDFDYNPDVEMARIKNIKKREKQLLDIVPGRRRTQTEKLDVKKEAERAVDLEEYLEKTAKYNERKKTDMEIMRRVYRERDLGKPPDTNDIREMAKDIKYKVYLKSMKASHPGYNHTKSSVTDNGDMDYDCTIPDQDTITNEARETTNIIFQKTETSLERDLDVVIHEPKPGTSAGTNYVYDAYKKVREHFQAYNSYCNHGWGTNRIETDVGTTDAKQPRAAERDQGQRMTLGYGHEINRKLQHYEKEQYHEPIAGCSNSNISHLEYEEMDCSTDEYDVEESEDREGMGEEISSQSRMTLWYGHNQSSGDDEDKAIDKVQMGSQKRKFGFDDDGGENFHSVKHRPTLWYGEHERMMTEEDAMGTDVKLNHNGLGGGNDGRAGNDVREVDAEETFTRTVPFLYLSTEDLPHRIRTETFTFKRAPPQSTDSNDLFLYSARCIIL